MLTQDRTLIAAVFAADDASRLLCFQKAAVFTADYLLSVIAQQHFQLLWIAFVGYSATAFLAIVDGRSELREARTCVLLMHCEL